MPNTDEKREQLEELVLKIIEEIANDFYAEPEDIVFNKNVSLVVNVDYEYNNTIITGELYDDSDRILTAIYDKNYEDISYEFDARISHEQLDNTIKSLNDYLKETV